MTLDKAQQDWIKRNQSVLNNIFGTHKQEILDSILTMPQGMARDIQIEFYKELVDWLSFIKFISEEQKTKKPDNGL
jgi:hypothetical protein